MKNVFIAAASMVAIIAIRMILSVALGEQVAEVFCKISISFLFFYFICRSAKYRKNRIKA